MVSHSTAASSAPSAFGLHETGDHAPDHARIVDQRPGDIAVFARPHLAHAGTPAHQLVAGPLADAAFPVEDHWVSVVGADARLEGRDDGALTPAAGVAGVEGEQGGGHCLDADQGVDLLAWQVERRRGRDRQTEFIRPDMAISVRSLAGRAP